MNRIQFLFSFSFPIWEMSMWFTFVCIFFFASRNCTCFRGTFHIPTKFNSLIAVLCFVFGRWVHRNISSVKFFFVCARQTMLFFAPWFPFAYGWSFEIFRTKNRSEIRTWNKIVRAPLNDIHTFLSLYPLICVFYNEAELSRQNLKCNEFNVLNKCTIQ